jgi:hypothetical protein
MTVQLLFALQLTDAERVGEGIGPGALAFMLVAMGIVLLLTGWCYWRILRTRTHFDPDGTGPAQPPVPGRVDPE